MSHSRIHPEPEFTRESRDENFPNYLAEVLEGSAFVGTAFTVAEAEGLRGPWQHLSEGGKRKWAAIITRLLARSVCTEQCAWGVCLWGHVQGSVCMGVCVRGACGQGQVHEEHVWWECMLRAMGRGSECAEMGA